MLSRDVKKLYDEKRIDELYKKNEQCFVLIDECSDLFINAGLLDEYQLASSMDKLSGCYSKLNPICGALEAMLEEYAHDVEHAEYSKLGEKVRTQDCSVVRTKARSSVGDLRRYASDFSRYCQSANSMIITAQSRLKRLTVEKGAKGVDRTGEVPQGWEQ